MSDAINFGDVPDCAFVRVYWSRAAMTDQGVEKATRDQPVVSPTFNQVLSIPGVAHIYGTAYELVVQRGERYAWEEIHPHVMESLELLNVEASGKRRVQ